MKQKEIWINAFFIGAIIAIFMKVYDFSSPTDIITAIGAIAGSAAAIGATKYLIVLRRKENQE